MNKQTKHFLELSNVERERNAAVYLLQQVIKSDIETELDRDIAHFLEKIDELPDEWIKYWEDDEK
jgi:hypothetical protein